MYRKNSYKILIAVLGLLVAAFTCPLHAQEYPFIRTEDNYLKYDSTALPMSAFFQKFHHMVSTGKGNISIMHIGGSHVQAGTFPHRIRTNILHDYPTLVRGRGLVFPYSAAAKCNNPSDYKVHCQKKVILTRNVYKQPEYPMGLCGISVTAHDVPTSIQILSNDKETDYRVSRVVVLGYTSDGIVPYLRYNDNDTPPSYIDTTLHRYVFNLQQEVDSIDIIIPCQEGQTFTLTGVLLDSRHPGITYHSIGVNGASVPDYLTCILNNDLRLICPDLVIFGIGINDAYGTDFDSVVFKNNYLRLCDSIRSVNSKCAFIFITNNDSYRRTGRRSYAVNRNGLQVRDVCYRLANLTGGAVWDQFDIMGGLKSMAKWQNSGLARRDKVHFTRNGYQLLGDLFYQALTRELDKTRGLITNPTEASKQVSPQQNNNTQKSQTLSDNERPLPRGLRRKPQTKKVSIEATPSTHKSSNSSSSHDRFPYVPD